MFIKSKNTPIVHKKLKPIQFISNQRKTYDIFNFLNFYKKNLYKKF